MTSREQLAQDFLPFADIGAGVPKVTEKPREWLVQLVKDGRALKFTLDRESGKVQFTKPGFPVRGFASVTALLASEEFANLRRWAELQSEFLKRTIDPKKLLPINVRTNNSAELHEVEQISALIGTEERVGDAAEVVLIDGPAGVGKTTLIEQLALFRASTYRTASRPLLLHVKSRGRVLSHLQDLMAFSLQSVRSTVTYDQIPVLARHGLVVVAIDGFDELGDPNGYELAWSQVNELIASVRGRGTVVLSGRDTFLGRARLLRDVTSLRLGVDIVTSVTLDAPTALQAKEWLRLRSWTDVHFQAPAIASLLEDGSFALRPVFLTLFADNINPRKIRDVDEGYLTPLLVKHMIQREAGKFGSNVESVVSKDEIELFLLRFLVETARDLADAQTDAIEDAALSWIVEASLDNGLSDDIVRLMKNRAAVIAFLRPDERQGYKSFSHSHLQNYFLSLAAIQTIGNGELPKFVRRNLLGSDFLGVFTEVAARSANAPELEKFLSRALTLPNAYSSDRAPRNVGALVLAAMPMINSGEKIFGFDVDEAVVRGTANPLTIETINIQQLDCRGADLSKVSFTDCAIGSLIADDASRFSPTFPIPNILTVGEEVDVSSREEVAQWLERRGRNKDAEVAMGIASPALKAHPIYGLLGRACRVRSYWLRAGDDIQADKILRDENWTDLAAALRMSGFLREEQRQASGKSSTFTHIRQRERILQEDPADGELTQLFKNLEHQIG